MILGFLIYAIILVCLLFWSLAKVDFMPSSFRKKWDSISNRQLTWEVTRGKKLIAELSKLEAMIATGRLDRELNLSQYKFYTDLILGLYEQSKKRGVNLKKYLSELRPKIQLDLKCERRILDEKRSGIVQFFLVSATTWLFIFTSQTLIEIAVSSYVYVTIFIMQSLGLMSFVFFTKKIQFNMFSPFSKALKEIFSFGAAIEVGVPVNLAVLESQILTSQFATYPSFENEYSFFVDSFNRLKETGVKINEDLQLIVATIFENQEECFQKFYRHLNFLKFLHLALVFLPAYFLYLASIFKFFMEQ